MNIDENEIVANNKRYRSFFKDVQKCLSALEKTPTSEWSSLNNGLTNLQKVLVSTKEIQDMPDKLHFFSVMSRCMDPSVAMGVHKKAVETLAVVCSKLTQTTMCEYLPLFTMHLFSLLQSSANQIRPEILAIIEKYVATLPVWGLRVALPGLLGALLGTYAEKDLFVKTRRILDLVRARFDTLEGLGGEFRVWAQNAHKRSSAAAPRVVGDDSTFTTGGMQMPNGASCLYGSGDPNPAVAASGPADDSTGARDALDDLLLPPGPPLHKVATRFGVPDDASIEAKVFSYRSAFHVAMWSVIRNVPNVRSAGLQYMRTYLPKATLAEEEEEDEDEDDDEDDYTDEENEDDDDEEVDDEGENGTATATETETSAESEGRDTVRTSAATNKSSTKSSSSHSRRRSGIAAGSPSRKSLRVGKTATSIIDDSKAEASVDKENRLATSVPPAPASSSLYPPALSAVEEIYWGKDSMHVAALIAAIRSTTQEVQKQALDLLLYHFPLRESGPLSAADKVMLVRAALEVLVTNQNATMRRVLMWLYGGESINERYFREVSAAYVKTALIEMFSEISAFTHAQAAAQRKYAALLSLQEYQQQRHRGNVWMAQSAVNNTVLSASALYSSVSDSPPPPADFSNSLSPSSQQSPSRGNENNGTTTELTDSDPSDVVVDQWLRGADFLSSVFASPASAAYFTPLTPAEVSILAAADTTDKCLVFEIFMSLINRPSEKEHFLLELLTPTVLPYICELFELRPEAAEGYFASSAAAATITSQLNELYQKTSSQQSTSFSVPPQPTLLTLPPPTPLYSPQLLRGLQLLHERVSWMPFLKTVERQLANLFVKKDGVKGEYIRLGDIEGRGASEIFDFEIFGDSTRPVASSEAARGDGQNKSHSKRRQDRNGSSTQQRGEEPSSCPTTPSSSLQESVFTNLSMIANDDRIPLGLGDTVRNVLTTLGLYDQSSADYGYDDDDDDENTPFDNNNSITNVKQHQQQQDQHLRSSESERANAGDEDKTTVTINTIDDGLVDDSPLEAAKRQTRRPSIENNKSSYSSIPRLINDPAAIYATLESAKILLDATKNIYLSSAGCSASSNVSSSAAAGGTKGNSARNNNNNKDNKNVNSDKKRSHATATADRRRQDHTSASDTESTDGSDEDEEDYSIHIPSEANECLAIVVRICDLLCGIMLSLVAPSSTEKNRIVVSESEVDGQRLPEAEAANEEWFVNASVFAAQQTSSSSSAALASLPLLAMDVFKSTYFGVFSGLVAHTAAPAMVDMAKQKTRESAGSGRRRAATRHAREEGGKPEEDKSATHHPHQQRHPAAIRSIYQNALLYARFVAVYNAAISTYLHEKRLPLGTTSSVAVHHKNGLYRKSDVFGSIVSPIYLRFVTEATDTLSAVLKHFHQTCRQFEVPLSVVIENFGLGRGNKKTAQANVSNNKSALASRRVGSIFSALLPSHFPSQYAPAPRTTNTTRVPQIAAAELLACVLREQPLWHSLTCALVAYGCPSLAVCASRLLAEIIVCEEFQRTMRSRYKTKGRQLMHNKKQRIAQLSRRGLPYVLVRLSANEIIRESGGVAQNASAYGNSEEGTTASHLMSCAVASAATTPREKRSRSPSQQQQSSNRHGPSRNETHSTSLLCHAESIIYLVASRLWPMLSVSHTDLHAHIAKIFVRCYTHPLFRSVIDEVMVAGSSPFSSPLSSLSSLSPLTSTASPSNAADAADHCSNDGYLLTLLRTVATLDEYGMALGVGVGAAAGPSVAAAGGGCTVGVSGVANGGTLLGSPSSSNVGVGFGGISFDVPSTNYVNNNNNNSSSGSSGIILAAPPSQIATVLSHDQLNLLFYPALRSMLNGLITHRRRRGVGLSVTVGGVADDVLLAGKTLKKAPHQQLQAVAIDVSSNTEGEEEGEEDKALISRQQMMASFIAQSSPLELRRIVDPLLYKLLQIDLAPPSSTSSPKHNNHVKPLTSTNNSHHASSSSSAEERWRLNFRRKASEFVETLHSLLEADEGRRLTASLLVQPAAVWSARVTEVLEAKDDFNGGDVIIAQENIDEEVEMKEGVNNDGEEGAFEALFESYFSEIDDDSPLGSAAGSSGDDEHERVAGETAPTAKKTTVAASTASQSVFVHQIPYLFPSTESAEVEGGAQVKAKPSSATTTKKRNTTLTNTASNTADTDFPRTTMFGVIVYILLRIIRGGGVGSLPSNSPSSPSHSAGTAASTGAGVARELTLLAQLNSTTDDSGRQDGAYKEEEDALIIAASTLLATLTANATSIASTALAQATLSQLVASAVNAGTGGSPAFASSLNIPPTPATNTTSTANAPGTASNLNTFTNNYSLVVHPVDASLIGIGTVGGYGSTAFGSTHFNFSQQQQNATQVSLTPTTISDGDGWIDTAPQAVTTANNGLNNNNGEENEGVGFVVTAYQSWYSTCPQVFAALSAYLSSNVAIIHLVSLVCSHLSKFATDMLYGVAIPTDNRQPSLQITLMNILSTSLGFIASLPSGATSTATTATGQSSSNAAANSVIPDGGKAVLTAAVHNTMGVWGLGPNHRRAVNGAANGNASTKVTCVSASEINAAMTAAAKAIKKAALTAAASAEARTAAEVNGGAIDSSVGSAVPSLDATANATTSAVTAAMAASGLDLDNSMSNMASITTAHLNATSRSVQQQRKAGLGAVGTAGGGGGAHQHSSYHAAGAAAVIAVDVTSIFETVMFHRVIEYGMIASTRAELDDELSGYGLLSRWRSLILSLLPILRTALPTATQHLLSGYAKILAALQSAGSSSSGRGSCGTSSLHVPAPSPAVLASVTAEVVEGLVEFVAFLFSGVLTGEALSRHANAINTHQQSIQNALLQQQQQFQQAQQHWWGNASVGMTQPATAVTNAASTTTSSISSSTSADLAAFATAQSELRWALATYLLSVIIGSLVGGCERLDVAMESLLANTSSSSSSSATVSLSLAKSSFFSKYKALFTILIKNMGAEFYEQIISQWQRQNSAHVMARFNGLGANTNGGGAAPLGTGTVGATAGGAAIPTSADAASLFGGADGGGSIVGTNVGIGVGTSSLPAFLEETYGAPSKSQQNVCSATLNAPMVNGGLPSSNTNGFFPTSATGAASGTAVASPTANSPGNGDTNNYDPSSTIGAVRSGAGGVCTNVSVSAAVASPHGAASGLGLGTASNGYLGGNSVASSSISPSTACAIGGGAVPSSAVGPCPKLEAERWTGGGGGGGALISNTSRFNDVLIELLSSLLTANAVVELSQSCLHQLRSGNSATAAKARTTFGGGGAGGSAGNPLASASSFAFGAGATAGGGASAAVGASIGSASSPSTVAGGGVGGLPGLGDLPSDAALMHLLTVFLLKGQKSPERWSQPSSSSGGSSLQNAVLDCISAHVATISTTVVSSGGPALMGIPMGGITGGSSSATAVASTTGACTLMFLPMAIMCLEVLHHRHVSAYLAYQSLSAQQNRFINNYINNNNQQQQQQQKALLGRTNSGNSGGSAYRLLPLTSPMIDILKDKRTTSIFMKIMEVLTPHVSSDVAMPSSMAGAFAQATAALSPSTATAAEKANSAAKKKGGRRYFYKDEQKRGGFVLASDPPSVAAASNGTPPTPVTGGSGSSGGVPFASAVATLNAHLMCSAATTGVAVGVAHPTVSQQHAAENRNATQSSESPSSVTATATLSNAASLVGIPATAVATAAPASVVAAAALHPLIALLFIGVHMSGLFFGALRASSAEADGGSTNNNNNSNNTNTNNSGNTASGGGDGTNANNANNNSNNAGSSANAGANDASISGSSGGGEYNSTVEGKTIDHLCGLMTRYLIPSIRHTNELKDPDTAAIVSSVRTEIILSLLIRFTELGDTVQKRMRNDLLDILFSESFFRTTRGAINKWRTLFAILSRDRILTKEVLQRLSGTAISKTAGVFTSIVTSAETETLSRAKMLRRLAFYTFCNTTIDTLFIMTVKDRLVDTFRNFQKLGRHVAIRAALFVFRVLMTRIQPHQVSSFWPVVLPEMVRILCSYSKQNAEFSLSLQAMGGEDEGATTTTEGKSPLTGQTTTTANTSKNPLSNTAAASATSGSNSPSTRATRASSTNINNNAATSQFFSAHSQQQCAIDVELTMEVLKIIDLATTILPSEFQVFRWGFLDDDRFIDERTVRVEMAKKAKSNPYVFDTKRPSENSGGGPLSIFGGNNGPSPAALAAQATVIPPAVYEKFVSGLQIEGHTFIPLVRSLYVSEKLPDEVPMSELRKEAPPAHLIREVIARGADQYYNHHAHTILNGLHQGMAAVAGPCAAISSSGAGGGGGLPRPAALAINIQHHNHPLSSAAIYGSGVGVGRGPIATTTASSAALPGHGSTQHTASSSVSSLSYGATATTVGVVGSGGYSYAHPGSRSFVNGVLGSATSIFSLSTQSHNASVHCHGNGFPMSATAFTPCETTANALAASTLVNPFRALKRPLLAVPERFFDPLEGVERIAAGMSILSNSTNTSEAVLTLRKGLLQGGDVKRGEVSVGGSSVSPTRGVGTTGRRLELGQSALRTGGGQTTHTAGFTKETEEEELHSICGAPIVYVADHSIASVVSSTSQLWNKGAPFSSAATTARSAGGNRLSLPQPNTVTNHSNVNAANASIHHHHHPNASSNTIASTAHVLYDELLLHEQRRYPLMVLNSQQERSSEIRHIMMSIGRPSLQQQQQKQDPFSRYTSLAFTPSSLSPCCDVVDYSYLQWLLEGDFVHTRIAAGEQRAAAVRGQHALLWATRQKRLMKATQSVFKEALTSALACPLSSSASPSSSSCPPNGTAVDNKTTILADSDSPLPLLAEDKRTSEGATAHIAVTTTGAGTNPSPLARVDTEEEEETGDTNTAVGGATSSTANNENTTATATVIDMVEEEDTPTNTLTAVATKEEEGEKQGSANGDDDEGEDEDGEFPELRRAAGQQNSVSTSATRAGEAGAKINGTTTYDDAEDEEEEEEAEEEAPDDDENENIAIGEGHGAEEGEEERESNEPTITRISGETKSNTHDDVGGSSASCDALLPEREDTAQYFAK